MCWVALTNRWVTDNERWGVLDIVSSNGVMTRWCEMYSLKKTFWFSLEFSWPSGCDTVISFLERPLDAAFPPWKIDESPTWHSPRWRPEHKVSRQTEQIYELFASHDNIGVGRTMAYRIWDHCAFVCDVILVIDVVPQSHTHDDVTLSSSILIGWYILKLWIQIGTILVHLGSSSTNVDYSCY